MIGNLKKESDIRSGDLKGLQYFDFMEWCAKYASCFSLIRYRSNQKKDEFDKLLEPLTPYLILRKKTEYYQPGYDECFEEGSSPRCGKVPTLYLFRSCDASMNIILKQTDSLWGWQGLALSDPCFYRPNGSLILHTVAHEAICWISCTENEYEELPNKKLWKMTMNAFDDEWYF